MIKIEVTSNFIGQEGTRKKGDKLVVHEARARYLIEHGLARMVPGPTQTKPAAPAETKGEPKKKSSAALTTGRSTASPSSSAPGPITSASASPVVQVSRPSRSRMSKRLTKEAQPGLLQ